MQTSKLISTLLVAIFYWTAAYAECPQNWVHYKESCYNFERRETTWNRAESECVRGGGHLVKIESFEENNFLLQHLRDNAHVFYGFDMWLGARVGPLYSWKWVDDTLMDPDAFNDWQTGRPANRSNVCLEFESDFNNKWNDDFCDELNYHICERPFDPLTPPPPTTPAASTAPTSPSGQGATSNTTEQPESATVPTTDSA